MTVAAELPIRVMVTDAWDRVHLTVSPDRPVGEVKEAALRRALGGRARPEEYEVKFRGALVLDERRTLAELEVPVDGALIVLPARRRPVR